MSSFLQQHNLSFAKHLAGPFLLLALIAVPAGNADAQSRTIRVGISEDFPPYEFVNKRGVADGYDVDLIRAVAEAMAVSVEFAPEKWSQVRGKLKQGQLDAAAGMLYSEERDRNFDFSLPHTYIHYSVFVRNDSMDIKGEEGLRGREVIVERGSLMHDRLVSADLASRIIEVETEPDAIRLLASGKHDAAIAPKIQGMLLVKELGYKHVKPVGPPLYSAKLCFAVREGDHDLRVLLDEGLGLVVSSGRYDEIYDKWFGVVDPRGRSTSWLAKYALYLLVPIGLLLLIALLGSRYLHQQVARRTGELTRYTAILDATSDLVSMATPDGKLLYLNRAGKDMLGLNPEVDIKGMMVPDVHPDWGAQLVHDEGFSTAIEAGIWTSENAVLTADGSEIPVSQVIMSHKSDDGRVDYFSTIMRDISLQKESEAELVRREATLRALARLAERLIRTVSWESVIDEALQQLGKATSVDRTYIFQNEETNAGELVMNQRYEWSADGVSTEIDNPELQGIPYNAPGMTDWRSRLSRGLDFHGIVRLLPPDLIAIMEPQGILSIVVVPIFVGDEWWGFLGFDDCTTEHEWSETEIDVLKAAAGILGSAIQRSDTENLLRETEQQMYRADKMAALGQIIAGVAHEINNPNNFIFFNLPILRTYIKSMSELLEKHVREDVEIKILNMSYKDFLADVDKLLGNMEHGSKRITGIVADLKNYVHSEQENERKPGDPIHIINQAMTLVGKQVRKTVKQLNLDLPESLPPIDMDAGKIEQVLINLVINAGQAADKDDSWIEISAKTTDPGWIEIRVADNGSGIPRDIADRIFDPFFTSKGREEGTGLGLSISHRIIEDHGGTLEVDSTPGEGATFTIKLPSITV